MTNSNNQSDLQNDNRAMLQLAAIAVVLVILIAVFLYLWLRPEQVAERSVPLPVAPQPTEVRSEPTRETEQQSSEPEPELQTVQQENIVEPEPQSAPLPTLTNSDNSILNEVPTLASTGSTTGLSSDDQLTSLITQENIIFKFVRAALAAEDGNVVLDYRPLESPEPPFIVEKIDEPLNPDIGQRYRLSSENYQRYQRYITALNLIDQDLLAAFYQRYYPLLNQAFDEQGIPDKEFHQVMLAAIDKILSAPIVETQPILVQPKVFFQYQDEQLESLSQVEKLLIRMGPDNARQLQNYLRTFKSKLEDINL